MRSWATSGSRAAALGAALLALAGLARAATASAPPQAVPTMDYMIQNVCVDERGRVQPISPLDPACRRQRDLAPGEPLPYHKHDWAPAGGPREGLQRGDSFPLIHPQLGLAAFHTFDWGGGGRRFGAYDGVNGDGGSLVAATAGGVASVMTIDQSAGVQIFVDGARCRGAVDYGALGGWAFAPDDVAARPSGQSQDLIRRVSALGGGCPPRYAHAITSWFLTDYAPMAGPGAVGGRRLRTLVSEHYSGVDLASSPNMERMYFTRELGRIRWERWQNQARGVRANDQSLQQTLEAGGRCVGGLGAPRAPGQWVMVRCHEWTNIQPASAPGGDDPRPWLSALATGTGAAPLQGLRP